MKAVLRAVAMYLVVMLLLVVAAFVDRDQAMANPRIDWGTPVSTVFTYTPRIVVKENIAWNNEVKRAVVFVDRYTKSSMRFGSCNSTDRCITINHGTVPGSARGLSKASGKKCVITVEKVSYSVAWKTRLLEHEISHCFGVPHNAKPTSIMYGPIAYKGVTVKEYFLSSERTRLAKG